MATTLVDHFSVPRNTLGSTLFHVVAATLLSLLRLLPTYFLRRGPPTRPYRVYAVFYGGHMFFVRPSAVVASLSWPDRGHHVPALTVTSGGRGVGFDMACCNVLQPSGSFGGHPRG